MMKANQSAQAARLAVSVFEKYGIELHRFLVNRLRKAEDAGDLAQEVYLRLLRLEKSELVRKPHAYAYAVASQVASQFRMHVEKDPVTYDSEAVEHSTENPGHFRLDAMADHLSAQQQLERLLAALPATHRAVLLLRKRDGMSWREIADELGLSVHTVKKYLFEARARLLTMRWDR